ncbi:MAG: hypothetical protein O2960_13425 [Verrucomicrobia bacterium]|nr:hypothetical protein [Verrucomicrobiota bacterium]
MNTRRHNTAWLLSFDIESASLTDADVIWPLFLRQLNRDDNPISPRLRGLFPDEIKRELDFIQRDSLEVLGSARSSIGTPRELDDSDSKGSSRLEPLDYIALKERLIEIVNEIVIQKPDFFQPEEISRLGGNLRPEVATLLQVRDKGGLSDDEVRQLNRLLLEQFYPNSILQRLGGTDKRLNHLIEQGRKKLSEQMPNVALYILKFSWNSLLAIIFFLFIGNQIAGVWGMILGVPIANYLLRDVFGVPVEADDK